MKIDITTDLDLYSECGEALGGAMADLRDRLNLPRYSKMEYPDEIQTLLDEAQDRLFAFAEYLKKGDTK